MSPNSDIVQLTPKGLYCPPGDFYIDPWKPVARAVVTHAHGDHAHTGHGTYFAHESSEGVMRRRLGSEIDFRGVPYRAPLEFKDTRVTLFPAGHVLGSAQVRIESDSGTWVVSGDYKRNPDPTCEPFEVVPCDVFITEATFAAPIYKWQSGEEIAREIISWWNQKNATIPAGSSSHLRPLTVPPGCAGSKVSKQPSHPAGSASGELSGSVVMTGDLCRLITPTGRIWCEPAKKPEQNA